MRTVATPVLNPSGPPEQTVITIEDIEAMAKEIA